MTIRLQPLRLGAVVVHYGQQLKPVCKHERGMNPAGPGAATVHFATLDWDQVTCPACIEWRHA